MGAISYAPLDGSHSHFICGSLCISDDLSNIWGEIIKNKRADGEQFENIAARTGCGRVIL